jgi:hypothetical protein
MWRSTLKSLPANERRLGFIRRVASFMLSLQVNTRILRSTSSKPAPQPVPSDDRLLSLGWIAKFACYAENLASFRKSAEYGLKMDRRVRLCGEVSLRFHLHVPR